MAKKAAEQKAIDTTIDEFFEKLQIDGEFSSTIQDDTIEVSVETENNGLIIGYHGEVLEALQLLLSLAVSKKLGRFVRVSLEVGDYKKNRTDYLTQLVSQTKDRVLAEGGELSLPNLKAWERRIVHMMLQEDKDVSSESIGEGKNRTLVIKPRAA